MLGKTFLLVMVVCFFSGTAQSQISSSQKKSIEAPVNYYGTFEVRHHLNTFFDDDGYRGKQEPSTHFRLQGGAQFYDKRLDIYGTLGVFKEPLTQQIKQKRPEVAVDLYPVRDRYYSLLVYNIVQVPFEEREQDPESDAVSSEAGSIYTAGLAPTMKYPFMAFNSEWKLKMGIDGWTKMYSRRQYADSNEDDIHHQDGFSVTSTEEDEPIEDFANHYELLSLVGIQLKPSYVPGLTTETTINYTRKFEPEYDRLENGNVNYHYAVEDRSYYRVRAKYKITDRVSFINDLYHFHGGFFESKRDGENRRFRNIARISCRL
jgi:hypothetical protein